VAATRHRDWRRKVAQVLWNAHPARPGAEYALIERSQWWPAEALAELQAMHLGRVIAAARQVPFYRERFSRAGIGRGSVRSVEDLRALPVLEREELRHRGVPGLRRPRSWGMRGVSSGSSGEPVEVLWPPEQMRWLDAVERRGRAWLGVELGDRLLEVRCRAVRPPQALGAALLNTRAVHAPAVADPDVLRALLRSIERRPPAIVHGISNALYSVALAVLEQGHSIPARACWSGGNYLHPHYRRALEEAFQCAVYQRYAANETGLIAHECREGRSLHVPAEGIITEIVRADGSPAPPGEAGDVLVTSLRNRATPLIRYRIGDRAIAPQAQECACGRTLPVFGTLLGRADDFLRTRTGESLSPELVAEAVGPTTESVIDFQVTQDERKRLTILVVQRDSPQPERFRDRIAATLEGLVDPPEPPSVKRVDRLPLTRGGKVRTLVSSAGP
jgi:phenylacetate-coenzyme A ligase PaaK-like adenylate-forming protein